MNSPRTSLLNNMNIWIGPNSRIASYLLEHSKHNFDLLISLRSVESNFSELISSSVSSQKPKHINLVICSRLPSFNTSKTSLLISIIDQLSSLSETLDILFFSSTDCDSISPNLTCDDLLNVPSSISFEPSLYPYEKLFLEDLLISNLPTNSHLFIFRFPIVLGEQMLWDDIISTKSVLVDDILANKNLAVIDISNILKDFDSLLDSPRYMSPINYIHSSLSSDIPVPRLFNHLSPLNTKCNPITALFRSLSILNFLFINRLFFLLRPIHFLLRIFVFFIIINRLVSLIIRKLSVLSLFLISSPSPSLYRLSYYTYTLSL